jgi:hypothetical protein
MRVIFLILLIFMVSASPNAARADECSDAPLPRLIVGESGEVASGIGGLRLRALPAIGAGTVRTLYDGNAFTVLAGPSCNSSYNWWWVEMKSGGNGSTGWLAEAEWSRYYLAPISDKPKTLCNSGETPWLYAFLSQVCSFLD